MSAHKVEIVFITIANRVAITALRVLWLGLTYGQTKLSQVLPARSCDRIGVPGWVPITEALAAARAGCCSGGN